MLQRHKQAFPEFPLAPVKTESYGLDWRGWLMAGETILTSTWTVSDGVSLSAEVNRDGICSVYVTGGEAGNFYTLTNTITTATRTESRSLILSCQ